jgi:hypothetical protein
VLPAIQLAGNVATWHYGKSAMQQLGAVGEMQPAFKRIAPRAGLERRDRGPEFPSDLPHFQQSSN